MKKKHVALILAVGLVLSLFAGCGKQETEMKEEPAKETVAETEKKEETQTGQEAEKEVITVEHLGLGFGGWGQEMGDLQSTEVYAEVVKQSGVKLETNGLDVDQAQVRIASGNLGDLVSINDAETLNAMVESDLLYPLNELIETYAPHILEELPTVIEGSKKLTPNEEGNYYVMPIRSGAGGYRTNDADTSGRYLYTVRWDLYKELGYPEMKTEDDLIKVMQDMIALAPETEEGRKVYGASFWNDLGGFVMQHQSTFGMPSLKDNYISRDAKTNELIYDFLEETSPYWRSVEYYYKANQAGILDPDAFVQTKEDFDARVDSGEIISPKLLDNDYEKTQLEKDPDSIAGFVQIPVEGTMVWQNQYSAQGWGASFALAIPKSCENPERVAEFIGYLFTEEACRMFYSGVEGLHWEYVDGVPVYTEETRKLMADTSSDGWLKTGIVRTPFTVIGGYDTSHVGDDGTEMYLVNSSAYRATMEFSNKFTDYNEYYGVSWPNEVFVNWVNEGKMYDLSGVDNTKSLNVSDEDINRIDTACNKIAIEALPEMVLAEDDAAFEAAKAKTMEAFKAAGAETAKAFYLEYWDSLK